jgi:hypothetical protein
MAGICRVNVEKYAVPVTWRKSEEKILKCGLSM